MQELLVLKNIKKSYGQKNILNGINLSIKEGEFFTFLGPSGCGKTTLLRIIAGFVQPDAGIVNFDNDQITTLPAEKRNIGMVFQNYALFPFMNVFDNVAYGLKISRENKNKIKNKVNKYLELVNLKGYENRDISELSGGEQQRVALARSLVLEPKLLLLDEPLSNLDARLRDKMRVELKEIQRKLGITTIFVTHDQTEALTMSDRIAVFNKGECIQVGYPNEIYSKPINIFVANFIGDMNLIKAKIINKKAIINKSTSLQLSEEANGDYISIRPQDILIKDKINKNENIIEGILKQINIGGNVIDYLIAVDSTIFRVIKLNTFFDETTYTIGQKVYLEINPNCIKTLNS